MAPLDAAGLEGAREAEDREAVLAPPTREVDERIAADMPPPEAPDGLALALLEATAALA